MVWENGCVVIVMLTPLVESGLKQCYHYWPDEGSNLYHIYEVRQSFQYKHDLIIYVNVSEAQSPTYMISSILNRYPLLIK